MIPHEPADWKAKKAGDRSPAFGLRYKEGLTASIAIFPPRATLLSALAGPAGIETGLVPLGKL